jgi:hypothetical protein
MQLTKNRSLPLGSSKSCSGGTYANFKNHLLDPLTAHAVFGQVNVGIACSNLAKEMGV